MYGHWYIYFSETKIGSLLELYCSPLYSYFSTWRNNWFTHFFIVQVFCKSLMLELCILMTELCNLTSVLVSSSSMWWCALRSSEVLEFGPMVQESLMKWMHFSLYCYILSPSVKKLGGFTSSPVQVMVRYEITLHTFVLNFKWPE